MITRRALGPLAGGLVALGALLVAAAISNLGLGHSARVAPAAPATVLRSLVGGVEADPGPFAVAFDSEEPALVGVLVEVDGVALPEYPVSRGDSPDAATGLYAYTTERVLALTPGSHTLAARVRSDTGTSPLSDPLVSVTIAGDLPPPPIDPCGPVGADAVSVTVTRWTLTSKAPGSQIRVDFQLRSASPVVEVTAAVDGGEVARVEGTALNGTGGLWFTQPAPGTHALTVRARNTAGCARGSASPVPLVIR